MSDIVTAAIIKLNHEFCKMTTNAFNYMII